MERPRSVLSLIRVSGKPQVDRTGIPRQIEDIDTICKTENLKVAPGDEYRFEGLSGASVESFPKYREMLSRLADPKLAGIVFSEVSRLFRPEFPDQLSVSKPFRVNGKLMFYEDGVLDLRKDRDQGIFISEAQKAGAHRKRIVKWTHWGKNQRRKVGNCKTDPIPAGVRFVPHKAIHNELPVGHFEYTDESNRVKEAFRLILAGENQTEVARRLHFGGVRPSATLLRKTLTSRWWIQEKATMNFRVGRAMRDDGTLFDGRRIPREDPLIVPADFNGAPPLVSREDFFAVQAILANEHKTWTKNRDVGHTKIEPFLGHGLVFCQCGQIMYAKSTKRRHCSTLYYICSSRANYNRTSCGYPILRQAVVDREIQTWATFRLISRKYLETLKPAQPLIDTKNIERQLAKFTKKKESQYRQIGDVKDPGLLMKLIAETESQIDRLESDLRTQPVPSKFDPAELQERFLHFAKMPLAQQKELIRATFSKITVDEEGSIIGVTLR